MKTFLDLCNAHRMGAAACGWNGVGLLANLTIARE